MCRVRLRQFAEERVSVTEGTAVSRRLGVTSEVFITARVGGGGAGFSRQTGDTASHSVTAFRDHHGVTRPSQCLIGRHMVV